MPEPYDLQELLKYNTDLNRFNSVNPWGSQTWEADPSGQWTMTQAISPDMQGIYDQQLAFLNQGNTPYDMPGPLKDSYQSLMDRRSQVWGATPGYSPDVPSTSQPRGEMGSPAPEATDNKQKLADALMQMGSRQGAPRWAQTAGRVIGGYNGMKDLAALRGK